MGSGVSCMCDTYDQALVNSSNKESLMFQLPVQPASPPHSMRTMEDNASLSHNM